MAPLTQTNVCRLARRDQRVTNRKVQVRSWALSIEWLESLARRTTTGSGKNGLSQWSDGDRQINPVKTTAALYGEDSDRHRRAPGRDHLQQPMQEVSLG